VRPGSERGQSGRRTDRGGARSVVDEDGVRRRDRDDRGRDAADEGQQQHDAGQSHAPTRGEIESEYPGSGSDRRRARRGGQKPAELRHRDEQQRDGDGDEDVVEAGQEAEVLLVHRRGRALGGDIVAEVGGKLRRKHARRHRLIEVAVAVHAGDCRGDIVGAQPTA
jgi:hypothetical protein